MIGKCLWVSARANLGYLTRSRVNARVRKRAPLGLLARAAWVTRREAYWVSPRARGRHRGPWRMRLTVPRATTHRITYIEFYINNAASVCRACPSKARHRLPFLSSSSRGKATSRRSATGCAVGLASRLCGAGRQTAPPPKAQNVAQRSQPANALRGCPAGPSGWREARITRGNILGIDRQRSAAAACLASFRSLCVAFAQKRLHWSAARAGRVNTQPQPGALPNPNLLR